MVLSNLLSVSPSLSGITAPKFGPFVVCALEHTLRVAHSAMPRPQQAAISLYVSGVLHHLLQTQVYSSHFVSF